MGGLDERERREVFRGHVSTGALRRLLARTARLYPRIFARVREHFGARGALCWVAGVAEAVWTERKGTKVGEAVGSRQSGQEGRR
jgi:hypothetical protein